MANVPLRWNAGELLFEVRSVHDGCFEGCSDASGQNSNEGAGSFQRFLPKDIPRPGSESPCSFVACALQVFNVISCALPQRKDPRFAVFSNVHADWHQVPCGHGSAMHEMPQWQKVKCIKSIPVTRSTPRQKRRSTSLQEALYTACGTNAIHNFEAQLLV